MSNSTKTQLDLIYDSIQMTSKYLGDGCYSCCFKFDGKQFTMKKWTFRKDISPNKLDALHSWIFVAQARRLYNTLERFASFFKYTDRKEAEMNFNASQKYVDALERVFSKDITIPYRITRIPMD